MIYRTRARVAFLLMCCSACALIASFVTSGERLTTVSLPAIRLSVVYASGGFEVLSRNDQLRQPGRPSIAFVKVPTRLTPLFLPFGKYVNSDAASVTLDLPLAYTISAGTPELERVGALSQADDQALTAWADDLTTEVRRSGEVPTRVVIAWGTILYCLSQLQYLWVVTTGAGALSLVRIARARRRAMSGMCEVCGYPREAGRGICPECGSSRAP